ncbi:ATP-binding protein [Aeromonas sp. CA23]|uniref:Dph6-related ATP pyrophosphatase n=1 Tax=Aeromonas sp. CA23 TaxID=2033032 RepID=UPI000BFD01CC|nr:ATP-binding protein [Aeromonas sp. CA23]ATL97570.1 ATP-binding protein [Aeromonas sp. CA23]
MKKTKVLLSWSSGKDSAWALHTLRQDPAIEVVGLFTTLNQAFERVAMHGVRKQLLMQQAECVGLPLTAIDLPWPCTNEDYARIMTDFIAGVVAEGIHQMAFGDLFLEDVRAYREKQLLGTGIEPLFPLWGSDTAKLAQQMMAAGLRARISTLDPKKLDASLGGHEFDPALLAALPAGVDPCGENGEFHTLAWDGPMFHRPLAIRVGETVLRDGFVFTDLLPADLPIV